MEVQIPLEKVTHVEGDTISMNLLLVEMLCRASRPLLPWAENHCTKT